MDYRDTKHLYDSRKRKLEENNIHTPNPKPQSSPIALSCSILGSIALVTWVITRILY